MAIFPASANRLFQSKLKILSRRSNLLCLGGLGASVSVGCAINRATHLVSYDRLYTAKWYGNIESQKNKIKSVHLWIISNNTTQSQKVNNYLTSHLCNYYSRVLFIFNQVSSREFIDNLQSSHAGKAIEPKVFLSSSSLNTKGTL